MRLNEKVAIITGGSRGIGKETALLFAKEGAKIVIGDFDTSAGEDTVNEIRRTLGEATFIQVNVIDIHLVQQMINKTVEMYGRIDILVNNAGITRDAFLTKISTEDWEQVIAVNLSGVFNCTRAVAPVMISQGSGRILNASSVVGIYGNIGQTNYAATKAGVIGMTRSWAKELGKKGITVNAVAPGFIMTDMTAKVPEKVLKMMAEKTPLGRLGQPLDVANAYLFLASDDASYINGAVLSVDGGLVL
ncbi:3-oxoacyl-ACP reductase FabG [Desulfotomaculum copahuensis]|uniref:3-oxoacyl-[acyl-carrier-protein] reductase n=1 Tax=Desulfotomaculum copahuensis TaxID=1838280 RepID=A0A1B7LEK0_9FIRM|nr:3-oxoacyl-ACP reductase FabG [Desulfotomaculum copahuensis]OAT81692.1 3-oxoacyl-[acyl-carrier-protein] reductase [Desulfotomaculum copahuensis]